MGKNERSVYNKISKGRVNRFDVTPAFRGLLLDLTVTFLIEQPTDIIQFGIDYFAHLRAKYTSAVKEKFPTRGEEPEPEEPEEEEPEEEPLPRDRRKSVFAETYNPEDDADETDEKPTIHPKTDQQRASLMEHVKKVLIFGDLQKDELNTILDAMFKKNVSPGEHVITQGDEGDFFYVIESGKFTANVVVGDSTKVVSTYDNKGSFGELALLYSMPRSASVEANTDGVLWCLDRQTFRRIVLKSAFKKRKLYEGLLAQVPMLETLSSYEKMNIADALHAKNFEDGDVIMREGDEADGMYFVESGTVSIRKMEKGKEVTLTTIEKGGYFGELALVTKQPRAATAVAQGEVKCAFLDTEAFERLLGPCKDLMSRNMTKYKQRQEEAEND